MLSSVDTQTYSGFYQQEIHSHLCDADLMFKEMGYRHQPNGTLLLKGTPCLDQVANVSRDALIAYVECQIISDIHAGLVRLAFVTPSLSRTKIAAVREQLRGDVQHTIDALAARYRRPPPAPTNAELVSNCPQHGHSIYANEHFGQPAQPNRCLPADSTCEHRVPFPPSQQRSHPPANALPHHHHAATIPHSRSLDQYVERQPFRSAAAGADPATGNKRHSSSFDQPGYHDHCRNGGGQYEEMPFAYNVPGNRYPIPLAYDGRQRTGASDPVHLEQPTAGQLCAIDDYGLTAYDTMRSQPEAVRTTTYAQTVRHNSGGYLADDLADLSLDQNHTRYDLQQQQQHLRAPLLPTPVDQRHQPTSQHRSHRPHATTTTIGRRPVMVQQQYAHPHPQPSGTMRPFDQVDANADYGAHDGVDNGSRVASRGCSDFDSTDDQHALAAQRHHQHNSSSSGAYASKCSDGIGSFDSWNYVYTKLEKDGYTKDLGERGDLLRMAVPGAEDVRTGRSAGADPVKPGRNVVQAKADESTVETVSRRPADSVTSRANGGGTTGRRPKEMPNVAQTLTKKSAPQQPPPTIRRNRSPAAITEWSCEHCTLLNPMSVRICAVCSRSKDCVGSAGRTTKATTTCV